MSTLKELQVSLILGNVYEDITDIVRVVHIKESLHRDLYGYMQVLDGDNVLDKYIGTNNHIKIVHEYKGTKISNKFYLDGVEKVSLTDSTHKEYIIRLISINNHLNGLSTSSHVYRGKSSSIINNIYKNHFGEGSLITRSESVTSGKYITPNINPKTSLKLILLNSYDKYIRPMFIYQRLADGGVSTLESLSDIISKTPMFTITTGMASNVSQKQGNYSIGLASTLELENSYSENVKKINIGIHGKTINIFDIENSKFTSTGVGEVEGAMEISRTYRRNLYGNSETPLLNGGNDALVDQAMTERVKSFSVKLKAGGVGAVPLLSVGHVILLDIATSKTQGTIHNGKYIVAGVDHTIIVDGKTKFYHQDLELIRK